jgi:hypothetical protein
MGIPMKQASFLPHDLAGHAFILVEEIFAGGSRWAEAISSQLIDRPDCVGNFKMLRAEF